MYAAKVETKYGLSVLLTLRKQSEQALKIYLPRRFNSAFKDEDITNINNGHLRLLFTFKGMTEHKAYDISLRLN
jgi:hypothetical protein